ncbi:MAG: hypothetical protein A3G41_07530 [Elusimicrobia bacterium RIFCSPLOWO2_12_FULL_59_9]|nr:MAG: hypothetical protein A3G41_07530 [Elusimicrobia bacterium RIFCSPLOWO2_12_FULL_59_9]
MMPQGGGGMLNIAHRGARSLAPENTMAAARKALALGADMWEMDMAVTQDGALIVFHDDSLLRTTDAKARFPRRSPWTFTDFSLEEIRSLDSGSWFVETDPHGEIAAGHVSAAEQKSLRGEKVPTLEEALLFTQESDWRINVELKRLPPPLENFPVVERVLDLIRRLKIDKRRVVFSSFNHAWVREVRARDADFEAEALVGFNNVLPMLVEPLEFKAYNMRSTLTNEAEVLSLTRRGIAVKLYVVNEEGDMRRFIAAGAAGLFTDFPQRLAPLKKSLALT